MAGLAPEVACASRPLFVQVDSLEAADKKIDELAASGKLDPALLLMMAKAYAGSKETDITQEEVGAAGSAASCELFCLAWPCCLQRIIAR